MTFKRRFLNKPDARHKTGGTMKITKTETAPSYSREGVTSFLMVSEATTGSKLIWSTIVEVQPGGKLPIHCHKPEQVYYIIEGEGTMTIGKDQRTVHTGDCVFIPENEPHGMANKSTSVVKYFSTAAPSFGKETFRRQWPLKGKKQ
jgi:mannose-6-phosphate isomerase-like protein (cupin superfamily)